MVSLMNSNKHLRNKARFKQYLCENHRRCGNTSQFLLWGQHKSDTRINPTPKLYKDIMIYEYYRIISLKSIDSKILNKIETKSVL